MRWWLLIGLSCSLSACGARGQRNPNNSTSSPSVPMAPGQSADDAAVGLLNEFLRVLLIQDPEQSAWAMLPLVHGSLKTPRGDALRPNIRQFSFKKAHTNAWVYQHPVRITRVRPMDDRGLSVDGRIEPGRVVDYFIDHKPDVKSMPAPVRVFFPADGSPPLITYMGNL